MPIAIYALAAAAFAIGTAEFVIAGILPPIAGDLGVSIPAAGLLVSFYALGVAIGGPILALFTSSVSRKKLVVTYVAIFILGHVACAIAASFQLLLLARILVALVHGAYFGAAMVIATALAPRERRGAATGLILAGLTVASIVGVPIGTAIGTSFGWRWTFWAVSGLVAVAFAAIIALVPMDPGVKGERGNALREIKALARQPVATTILIIITQTIGQFAIFTYISPLATEVSGIPADLVPVILFLFGVGSTIGALVGGRLADWKLMPSLIGILAIQVVVCILMALFARNAYAMGVLILVWSFFSFAFGPSVQTRILTSTQDAPLLASNLIPSSFNVGIAAGAWLGGLLIDRGLGYGILPWVGAVGVFISMLLTIWAYGLDRRPTAAAGG